MTGTEGVSRTLNKFNRNLILSNFKGNGDWNRKREWTDARDGNLLGNVPQIPREVMAMSQKKSMDYNFYQVLHELFMRTFDNFIFSATSEHC